MLNEARRKLPSEASGAFRALRDVPRLSPVPLGTGEGARPLSRLAAVLLAGFRLGEQERQDDMPASMAASGSRAWRRPKHSARKSVRAGEHRMPKKPMVEMREMPAEGSTRRLLAVSE